MGLDERLTSNRTGAYMSKYVFEGMRFDNEGVPELDWFDMSKIKPDGTIVNFGKRRTGKSVLTKNQCWYLQEEFPRGIVISVTEELNHWYREFIPSRFVHNELTDKLIADLLAFQKEIKLDPDYEEMKAKDPSFSRCFVIFDDVISDPNRVRFSVPLTKIFVAGRHYDILSIFNTQYPKAIPPNMRDNIDYFFVFRSTSGPTREFLWNLVGDSMPKNLFFALIDKYTRDHGCLVIDNTDSTEDALVKKIFQFRADINIPDFRMGDDEYWEDSNGTELDANFKEEFG